MAISGTRGALFVIIMGYSAYFLLSNNMKILVYRWIISFRYVEIHNHRTTE